ncbi:hypothetical protein T459_23993 [Capsicum annuum]|uniref:Transposase-associated domain-containing protein n=1 Tax=Capsicum annuum TaxID=4072 RepID=A0A2G2XTR7_CAPAN|nr:hypothetical protein T459_35318 [Capsicum annuum]PHT73208.1 hypothetical protein T459_23993 [Capsicum annuum]
MRRFHGASLEGCQLGTGTIPLETDNFHLAGVHDVVLHQVMAPSKQWMQLFLYNRTDKIYLDGAKKFVNYAFREKEEECEIRCPCYKCCHTTLATRKMIEMHLKFHGIIENYIFWFHHGEQLGEPLSDSEDRDATDNFESEDEDEVQELLRDLYPNAEGGGGT